VGDLVGASVVGLTEFEFRPLKFGDGFFWLEEISDGFLKEFSVFSAFIHRAQKPHFFLSCIARRSN
jgi:hypothetical protein